MAIPVAIETVAKAPTVILMIKSAFNTRCSSDKKGVANLLYESTNTAPFRTKLIIDIKKAVRIFFFIIITLFYFPKQNFSALI